MSRRLQTYSHDGLTVTFDPSRCIHSAACIRSQPAVFDSAARPWVRPERADGDAIIAAVQACPSGALRVFRDVAGEAAPVRLELPDEPVAVRAMRNGPLVVRGRVKVMRDDGSVLVEDTQVTLCRCGHSRQMPLCDNSHRAAGFRDAPAPAEG